MAHKTKPSPERAFDGLVVALLVVLFGMTLGAFIAIYWGL